MESGRCRSLRVVQQAAECGEPSVDGHNKRGGAVCCQPSWRTAADRVLQQRRTMEIHMAASGEKLDVDEFGPECSEASALAELSDVDIVINGFEQLMALSDAELSALAQ